LIARGDNRACSEFAAAICRIACKAAENCSGLKALQADKTKMFVQSFDSVPVSLQTDGIGLR
jgi:hypothetical protein